MCLIPSLFAATLLLIVLTLFLVYMSRKNPWSDYDVAAIFSGVGSVLMLIVSFAVGIDWAGAKYKADIINREYGTNYTREEVFFASDVIDTIRQLDRKRVEVNGDVFREKPDAR